MPQGASRPRYQQRSQPEARQGAVQPRYQRQVQPQVRQGAVQPRDQRQLQPQTRQRVSAARAPAPGGQTAPARFSGQYGGNFRPPVRDQSGQPLNARPLVNVTRDTDLVHRTVADPAFGTAARSLSQASGERDGRFHWHENNGARFSHWHDAAHDRDWFGVYQGRRYFWTTLWHDHFWWREPASGRYLVFWQDHWWWHSPEGVAYVYVDDQYYEWIPGQNGTALVPAAEEAKPEGVEGSIVSSRPEFNYSADGTRLVQIEGEKLSAFLYATSPEERDGTKPMKFLGDNVTAVAFSDTSKQEPLRIVLSVQNDDGSIRTVIVDNNGEPLGASTPPAPPSPPAPAPIVYGTPGAPGYDAPQSDLPPSDPPFPDGQ